MNETTGTTPDSFVDWADDRERLSTAARNDAPWYDTLAASLIESADSLALDVGCGGAGMALALTRALPDQARVLALDASPELLEAARENLAEAGVDPRRATVVRCDLEGGLDAVRAVVPGPADIVWASGAVHHVADQQATVDALAALLAPGGRLALAEGGLRPRLLPWDVGVGEPGLEVRLDAAQDVWFGQMRAALPGSVPMPYGWNEAFRRAGLTDIASRSTLIEQPPPLTAAARTSAIAGLAHRVTRMGATGLIGADDLAAWNRLLDTDDTAWLGRRDDLFVLEARTVHVGRRGSDENGAPPTARP